MMSLSAIDTHQQFWTQLYLSKHSFNSNNLEPIRCKQLSTVAPPQPITITQLCDPKLTYDYMSESSDSMLEGVEASMT